VPRDTELTDGTTVVVVRSIPLQAPAPLEHVGALVLLRDVTDLRSRDRELVTKDATIREIHHRVKNNLQTVAALLRLQARRTKAPEARNALEEAVRRVGSIALVHETLSQSVDESVEFDAIADRLRQMVTDLGAADASVATARRGSFGTLTGQVASSLAMVLTELLQNATEHGFAGGNGTLEILVERSDAVLRVAVCDDGRGLPEHFDPHGTTSLGLSIVRTLVESELNGRLRLSRRTGGGTEAEVVVPLG
jgi:two-component sensor histidine kinase